MARSSGQLSTPDGRRLEYELSGPADGAAVVFHTGTPSAGTMFEPMVRAGEERGMRHLAYSRPGYGASERLRGRSVADCARDVAALADELSLERFYTVGWSGGGPHALACAALLGERTIAAATLGGVAPRDADGLAWSEGMGAENLEEFAAADAGEERLRGYLEEQLPSLTRAGGRELEAALGDLVSEVDRSALSGEYADYFAAAISAGLAHGVWGWLDDDVAFTRGWGFELAQIERPVTVWQGREDRFVPFEHGRWLAEHVPHATPRPLEHEGHLSMLVDSYGSVLDQLLGST